jgi:hypothetical protein
MKSLGMKSDLKIKSQSKRGRPVRPGNCARNLFIRFEAIEAKAESIRINFGPLRENFARPAVSRLLVLAYA